MANLQELTKKEFSRQGNKYKYWVIGDEKKTPLVIFYGYTGLYIDFTKLCALLKEDYFIVIPEYPGWYGNSRIDEELSINNYAKFFNELIYDLGLKNVNLLGHCVGATVAIEYALLYPKQVNNLLLLSTPFMDGFIKKFFSFLVKRAKNSPKPLRFLFFLWRSRLITLPLDFFVIKEKGLSKYMRMKDHFVRQSKQGEDAVEENWMSYVLFDFSKVKKISCPMYLIHGDKDLYFSLNKIKKIYKFVSPSTELHVIPKAGHVPPIETPNKLSEIISGLIKP